MRMLVVLLLMLLALPAMAQQVEFVWDQPTMTLGSEQTPPLNIPDGYISRYIVHTATATDTLVWGEVTAPVAIADSVTVLISFDILEPKSIAVQAVDQLERVGPLSEWSDAFIVDPGPPASATQPRAIGVYLGS